MQQEIKEKFIKLFKDNIKRDGSDKLLDWLIKTDFFTAPASTKFHSAYEGGLCEHSINAYERYLKLVKNEYGENWNEIISEESIAIIGLLHDICKVNCYKTELRNVKVDGNWVQKPYYTYEDNLPYGHGEKSVYIITGFMKLTRDEAMAINWHMGGFDVRVRNGASLLSDAFYLHPLSLLFHIADLQATYLDETTEK